MTINLEGCCSIQTELRIYPKYEKRESNPQPQPWQGYTLPVKLFSFYLEKMRFELMMH